MSFFNEARKKLDRWLGVPLVLLAGLVRRRSLRARSCAPARPVRTILFIKLWGIGNLTMLLPLVRAARRAHPAARVLFLTLERNRRFLAASGLLDEVLVFSEQGLLRPLWRLVRLAVALRRRRIDLLLDFEQFLKTTALLAWLARPARSVGFRTPSQHRHGLYDVEVPHDQERHMALVFGDVARAGGLATEGLPPLMVPRSAAAGRRMARMVRRLRNRGAPLVAIHAGSGDNFPGRRWPPASFAALADALWRRTGATLLFTGTAGERRLIRECTGRMQAPALDAGGRFDVVELIELLARVDLLVTNDTGPVHLASALGIPLVALYGPNTPRLYGPLSPHSRVFHAGLPCSPCITNSNAKTSHCRSWVCLAAIAPEQVAVAALELIAAKPPAETTPGVAPRLAMEWRPR